MERLEALLTQAMAEIDRLSSIEAIRQCIYRISRGTDRVDAALLRSAFHPGAKVHFGKIYDGDAEGWIEATIKHQAGQSQRHHLVGNIFVEIDGDLAVAESYALDRHKTPIDSQIKDLVLAARTLDRFARRNGEWKIVDRTKIMDWGRSISADDGIYQKSALIQGGDDRADASYGLFANQPKGSRSPSGDC
jgi:hypothetical protein